MGVPSYECKCTLSSGARIDCVLLFVCVDSSGGIDRTFSRSQPRSGISLELSPPSPPEYSELSLLPPTAARMSSQPPSYEEAMKAEVEWV